MRMHHHASNPEYAMRGAQKALNCSYFGSIHAFFTLCYIPQTQLACKLNLPDISSVRFAITRLLSAQTTNSR
jgi:hypothetical protein